MKRFALISMIMLGGILSHAQIEVLTRQLNLYNCYGPDIFYDFIELKPNGVWIFYQFSADFQTPNDFDFTRLSGRYKVSNDTIVFEQNQARVLPDFLVNTNGLYVNLNESPPAFTETTIISFMDFKRKHIKKPKPLVVE